MSQRINTELLSARREHVLQSYNSAVATNRHNFLKGMYKATSEYIYPNQIEDAHNVANLFYQMKRNIISITKKTKVGADGFMIEVIKLLATHPDDDFIINEDNVRILTGMSNVTWQNDMTEKSPTFLKDKIFHHGKLSKADLKGITNGLIIIDEIDSGDKESQVLHKTLKESGILDVIYIKEKNIKIIIISASIIKELYDTYRWGDLHQSYKLIIPSSYIGHYDFLKMKIIQEFYNINTKENAEKYIQEDVLDYYRQPCMCMMCNPEQNNQKKDFRVHIVRVNGKSVNMVHNACIKFGVNFINHTSTDRLSEEDIELLFGKTPLTQHHMIGIKGLWRRATLIPDCWKKRIGSTHELYTNKVDNNVQNQGLPGRMTGYWRPAIENGHKIGPYRTSMKAIQEIEDVHIDPFGKNTYQTAGFKKDKKGKVSSQPTLLSAKNIENLTPTDLPVFRQKGSAPIISFTITEEEESHFENKSEVLKIFMKYDLESYNIYKLYKVRCWRIDSPDKWEKYGNAIIKQNAYSTTTCIRESEKTTNVLMIYLDPEEHKIYISPWNGEETK